MKKIFTFVAVTGLSTALASGALAAPSSGNSINAIKDMKNGASVSLEGTIDDITNEREFVLRDSSGTIAVDIESNQSVVFEKGDTVTVKGLVDNGLTGTDINASEILVHKSPTAILEDAIEGHSNMSLQGATAYTVEDLPKNGKVKVLGVVADVDSEKEFTLKDTTGSIDVEVESAENAAIVEGAQVTVIGVIDDGLLGKEINATQVLVTGSGQPVAKN